MDMTSQQFDKQNGNAKTQSSSTRSEFVQQKRSSSPRQLRTTESALPNKPDIREFVCIKKSPSSARKTSSQDYVTMSPLAVPTEESRSYVNYSPGSNPKRSLSPNSDSTNQREDSNRYYVNFTPGENFANRARQIESPSPRKLINSSVDDSSSYEDMHSYVNFSPGKIVEQKATGSNFRKHSLESVLLKIPREYENVDFSGIAKSRSAVDVPEYVNYVPGKPFESSDNVSSLANGDKDTSVVKALNYVNVSPGKPLDENERWRRSPRSNRRESEPARLEPLIMCNSQLDTTQEDKEIKQLNYVMLDLNNAENSSESPSRQRRRPPNIDLRSCRRASPGPKSAPVKSAYAEVDFTKSDGIRQARQEIREPTNTSV